MLRFVAVNAVGFAALALLAAWLLAGVHRGRPWDAAFFALSPALLLAGLVNWDMLAVTCVAAALWAWSRDRTVLTGAMIGLGVATKLFPLFLLGGILVICLRQRRFRELGEVSGAAAVTWLLLNAPAYVAGPEDWKTFWRFNSDRTADLGSIWLVLDQRFDWSMTASTINLWSWLFFGAWCVAVLVIGLAAPATPRLAQLGFLVVAGFLLVNKVYSPQYVLWLLPLAVLARPRLRDQVIWQATEVVYFATVWWYLGSFLAPADGGDAEFYWFAIVLRMAGELYLVGIIVRDVLWPRHDPVRELGWRAYVRRPSGGEVALAQVSTTRSNVVAVNRTRTPTSSPTAGTCAPDGRKSIDACMCGGSANSRCLPSMVNGDRTKPTASRPPRARVAARAFIEESPVGASRPMPWAVPPLTTTMWPDFGALRPR